MKEAGFSRSMHPRNGIEGTHSELVRGHGLRDKISRFKPGRSIALLHGRSLQRETIPKSARVPDENTDSEPGLRAQGRSFYWLWHRCGCKFTCRKTILLSVAFASGDGKLN